MKIHWLAFALWVTAVWRGSDILWWTAQWSWPCWNNHRDLKAVSLDSLKFWPWDCRNMTRPRNTTEVQETRQNTTLWLLLRHYQSNFSSPQLTFISTSKQAEWLTYLTPRTGRVWGWCNFLVTDRLLLDDDFFSDRLFGHSTCPFSSLDKFLHVSNFVIFHWLVSAASCPSLILMIRGPSGQHTWTLQLHLQPREGQTHTQVTTYCSGQIQWKT